MNLSDDLVQSKCKMMLNGQKPTLLIGGSKCAESGESNETLNSLHFVFNLCKGKRSEGSYHLAENNCSYGSFVLELLKTVIFDAHPDMSWHDVFVKMLTGARQ